MKAGDRGGFGWGGVGGWGENADNCDRVTIKIKNKKKSMCVGSINVRIVVPTRMEEGGGDWERHVEARVPELSTS